MNGHPGQVCPICSLGLFCIQHRGVKQKGTRWHREVQALGEKASEANIEVPQLVFHLNAICK